MLRAVVFLPFKILHFTCGSVSSVGCLEACGSVPVCGGVALGTFRGVGFSFRRGQRALCDCRPSGLTEACSGSTCGLAGVARALSCQPGVPHVWVQGAVGGAHLRGPHAPSGSCQRALASPGLTASALPAGRVVLALCVFACCYVVCC